MLKDLTSEKLIQLNATASDWIEAVQVAAKPLLDEGKITEGYIQGIIDSAKEVGPYFVITPHVALPHARPEAGVLESSIGITTLTTPVEFGNEANDPVKYLFTLSATDNDQHLSALADLAELLEDESFFNTLDTATSSADVMNYIKNR